MATHGYYLPYRKPVNNYRPCTLLSRLQNRLHGHAREMVFHQFSCGAPQLITYAGNIVAFTPGSISAVKDLVERILSCFEHIKESNLVEWFRKLDATVDAPRSLDDPCFQQSLLYGTRKCVGYPMVCCQSTKPNASVWLY